MGSKSTTTQKADPWKPAQPYLKEGMVDAGNLYDVGGFQVNPYAGDMVANADPLQTQAYNAAAGLSGTAAGNIGAATGALNAMLDPNQQSSAFQQTLQNTLNGIMPQINGSFAGSGMTGSGLHAQNLAKGVSAGIADAVNNNWQQGQNRALNAANSMAGMNSAMFGANDYLNQYGTQAQGQNQNEINAQVLYDQQSQSAEANAIKDYMSLMSGMGGQFGTSSSTQSSGGGLMSVLGLGLQAAPLFMPSDRRIKENIKRVGQTDDGLPIYTYTYKGGNTYHMGVMAQDVAEVKPEAVGKLGNYLAVNYGAL